MKRKKLHSEDKIQQDCVEWFNNNYCLKFHNPRYAIFHVPNQNQQHLVKIGVKGGVADLIVFGPDAKVCLIEMKEAKGKQKENQKEWQAQVEQLGFQYFICRSLPDFQKIISRFVANNG